MFVKIVSPYSRIWCFPIFVVCLVFVVEICFCSFADAVHLGLETGLSHFLSI